MTVTEEIYSINSAALNREVTYAVFKPEGDDRNEPLNLLLMNDGQETDNLQLKETLENLTNNNRIKPLIVVAIHANEDRLQEYGTAGHPDFKQRGSKAEAYTHFIVNELVPAITAQTNTTHFANIAFAGFSLGGLSALDIAWNNPQLFNKAGVFSGSLWWRSKGLDEGYTDEDRIMHSIIRNSAYKPNLKFWLQTGTKDETADRNRNGIIDSIDDTVDLIRELEEKGYSRPADIHYLEMVNGHHNFETWAIALPKFLCWAFGK